MPFTLADAIEAYILSRLDEAGRGILEVRRRELADRFRCAPSQINYVLATRFTPERGFVVRSRRGGGGGILITLLAYDEVADVLRRLHRQAGRGLTQAQAFDLVRFFHEQEIVTDREARLVRAVFGALSSSPALDSDDLSGLRGRVMQSLLAVLMS
jgi:transcriptional regulator CtsR